MPLDGAYFADILVRGQPLFQVGSLLDLSASQRVQMVNWQMKGILVQSKAEEAVKKLGSFFLSIYNSFATAS